MVHYSGLMMMRCSIMALSFKKDLEKYKEIDEDEILNKLSEEELKQLESALEEMDPENALLPAGLRQKDQTTKTATGSFDREKLLHYLEKQALEHKDRDDCVPFTREKKELGHLEFELPGFDSEKRLQENHGHVTLGHVISDESVALVQLKVLNLNLGSSRTVVVGGLWNCQSAVRKADFISALASHYSFDFLALTETWISPQNTATPAALSSPYTFSHSPRESGRGGGTVSVTSPINLFIIVIYRPPGPLGNFLDEMDTLLSVFPSDSTPLTVLGDFNLPSDKLHSSGLLALLNSSSLSFKSCPPTHKEGNVLDLVFTHRSPATDMTVTPLHISDHHLVSITITLPILPKRNSQHLSLTHRNLHSISPSSVASCTLSSLPDHESFSSLPLDSATDTLLSSFSSTMDLLCPLSTIRKKNSSTAPWLSDVLRNNRRELRSAARKWKKSKLDTDLISYRTLLSNFFLNVTSAKTSFYKEKLETSAQDPRKLHNIFSSLLNPPAPPSPSSLTAEDFATFYT
ncbi:hypothetical protein QTP70_001257 [Hemibagrus guttatus]|uniref:Endonuclease/exonuclease/phosphatase domain-containing protein n=1 Tax=Hemibagrus guttatus TaxID=175788 RepID=A0AAE0V7R6_9TELE|nr:hypothetical protein QTP70_001257 [Hemibagrus guttatus]